MNKPSILLVDDEPDVLRTLQFRLEAAGFEVTSASDGAEAVSRLRDGRVDLVLADFMMPEMNGIEMARTVKANPLLFDTKILLFSANPDPEFRRRAIEMGAADYISKTVGAQVIVERARQLIGAGEAPSGAARGQDEADVRASMAALARSLAEILHLARAESLPRSAEAALNSADRIVEEMRSLTAPGGLD